jgi:hypothetical protein
MQSFFPVSRFSFFEMGAKTAPGTLSLAPEICRNTKGQQGHDFPPAGKTRTRSVTHPLPPNEVSTADLFVIQQQIHMGRVAPGWILSLEIGLKIETVATLQSMIIPFRGVVGEG